MTAAAGGKDRTGVANCEGAADVADAALILRYAIADAEASLTDQGVRNGDAGKNGRTDGDDAALILQFIAKRQISEQNIFKG